MDPMGPGVLTGERTQHRYLACRDEGCQRFACRVYKEGYQHGYGAGHATGYAQGHAAGFAEGHAKAYAEGHSDGYAEGAASASGNR